MSAQAADRSHAAGILWHLGLFLAILFLSLFVYILLRLRAAPDPSRAAGNSSRFHPDNRVHFVLYWRPDYLERDGGFAPDRASSLKYEAKFKDDFCRVRAEVAPPNRTKSMGTLRTQ